MNFRTLAAAAAIAFVPALAGAATLDPNNDIVDGGVYNLSNGPFNWGIDFEGGDVAGSVEFTFVNDTSATGAASQGTVLQFTGEFFDGVTAAWTNGESETIASGTTGLFHVTTTIAFGASDTLTVSWGDVTGDFADIDLAVAAVPLPAAGLLLLGGLGAMAASRRKKKAS